MGRGYYKRTTEAKPGYRNGYENKSIKTAEGRIEIDVPQLRDTEEPYRSTLLRELKSISPELERLAIEMYVQGLSTRDIEEALKGPDGRTLISKDGVMPLLVISDGASGLLLAI
ncbi:transposase [bacterium]|nr:transposase [bacterium]